MTSAASQRCDHAKTARKMPTVQPTNRQTGVMCACEKKLRSFPSYRDPLKRTITAKIQFTFFSFDLFCFVQASLESLPHCVDWSVSRKVREAINFKAALKNGRSATTNPPTHPTHQISNGQLLHKLWLVVSANANS